MVRACWAAVGSTRRFSWPVTKEEAVLLGKIDPHFIAFTGRAGIVCFAVASVLEIGLDGEAGRGKNRLAAGISVKTNARADGGRDRERRPRDGFLSTSQVEDQPVRTTVGVALVSVCLGLAGCSLFGKKSAAHTNNNSKPFLGSDTPTKKEIAAIPQDADGPLPGASGTLAGKVLVEATGRPAKAFILVKNVQDEDSKDAKLEVQTDEAGYFFIPGLKVGKQYELSVRANEEGELISAKSWAKPPRVTLLIRLNKSNTTPSTPKVPDMPPNQPDKKGAAATESSQERTPSVSIEAPIKLPDQDAPSSGGSAPPSIRGGNSSGGPSPNPANIAAGGFRRLTQPSQPATIPSPPPVPGTPTWEAVPEQPRPGPAVPASPGSVRLPNLPTLVPSCGLYGNHLDNFALRDLDGKVWEYKRDKHGRLTLLDFWASTCGPCLQAIDRLNKLQEDYGPYGLQVVGIACEIGTLEEQQRNVRSIRYRKGINYITLLSGGGLERCPVFASFQVVRYPKLVLIDAEGTIVWHSPDKGMDDYEYNRLRTMINNRLVARQSVP